MWWNPCALFGLADGGRVDGGEFHRLYHGFAPNSGERLTRNAGSEKRSPGLDMTFQRRQERLRLVGYRRSGAAFGDRVRAQ